MTSKKGEDDRMIEERMEKHTGSQETEDSLEIDSLLKRGANYARLGKDHLPCHPLEAVKMRVVSQRDF